MAHRLEFSEFTFGFALTENFARRSSLKGVPIFPSLTQEGQSTGGYDVSLSSDYGLPLLLQFKVPQVVNRRSALIPKGFPRPYYRAELRCRRNEQGFSQHSVLLEHEQHGHEVYYVMPRFHRTASLDNFFLNGCVVEQSAFFQPSDVGNLTDEPHHVAYCRQLDEAWLRSDPVKLPHPVSADRFLRRMERLLSDREREPVDFEALLESMVSATERGTARAERRGSRGERRWEGQPLAKIDVRQSRLPPRTLAERIADGRSPRRAAALFARLCLNAELVLVTSSTP